MGLDLITYGLGNHLLIDNITQISNKGGPMNKPVGGLWASPVSSKYGWKEWCNDESYSLDSFNTSFQFSISGNILKIDNENDLNLLNWIPVYKGVELYQPDFESLFYSEIDAIWLTENGQNETRFSCPHSLYGWDCESVLIMNPVCIE